MCGLVSRLSILFHWAMCLFLCHQPSFICVFILKLLILFFSVVTVSKLCPSPHVPPRLLPSGKDYLYGETEVLSFAFLWICVTTVTYVPDPGLAPAPPSSRLGWGWHFHICSAGPPSVVCPSVVFLLFPSVPASAFLAYKKRKRGLDSHHKEQKFLAISPDHPPAVLLTPSACLLVKFLKGHSLPNSAILLKRI